ncbi:MAG: hypothetical protein LH616_16775 [Ilumatobacteraceae bacterium]|nr:hypothetical protein [Ilumatobacteraceae bacterium]
MNTPTLEDQLRSHYVSKADELRLPSLEFEELLADSGRGVVVSITSSPRGHRGSWWVAAAAVAAVTVGGLAIIQGRDTPSNTPVATQPGEQLSPPATASTIGLFPAGDAAAVVAQAYQTPASVATAYLADRTSGANLPTGYTAKATTGEVVTVDESHALVNFNLEVDGDSGDGIVQVEQVRDSTGSAGWVVTAASVASMEIKNLSYIDGRLLGNFASGWGTTQITVLDAAAAGAVLATRSGTPVPPDAETPPDQWIDIADLAAPSVVVRAWRTPTATFSETLISAGQQGVVGGWTPLAALAFPEQPPFFGGSPVSALDSLAMGETIKANTPTDVTVEASQDAGTLCISASIAEVSGSSCFDLGMIALGTAAISLDPDASGRVLVAGIVPDVVSSISEGSTIIQPTQNLWFIVTDAQPHSFNIANSDGTKVVTLAIG